MADSTLVNRGPMSSNTKKVVRRDRFIYRHLQVTGSRQNVGNVLGKCRHPKTLPYRMSPSLNQGLLRDLTRQELTGHLSEL